MSDRAKVLACLERVGDRVLPHPGSFALPSLAGGWESFCQKLASVGGEALGPVAPNALAETVMRLCERRSGGGRVTAESSAGTLLGEGPWEILSTNSPPREFADVSVAIVRGSLAVAENAAVGVAGKHARARALCFLCEHLVLLLATSRIVPDMHSATRQMPPDATGFHHFTWISGPSKTADIEQTIVLGAHGPRSLVVVGIGNG